MKNFKSHYLKKTLSMVLAVIMMITLVPLGVFAQDPAEGNTPTDALSSATYYTKPNWEARIRDKSRWKVEDSQTLVRVTTSDPVRMNDIDYDGMYINANGRYVIRLIYKERTQSPSAVWHTALINFGDLDEYIDFSNSYVFGRDGKTRYTFDPVKGVKGRGFDVASAVGDRTNGRKNLPINLVLKDGVTLDNLPKENYIIQMRLCDDDYVRVYAYAPGKSSMDYSTYTKTTSVSLQDNLNNLFIKGGLQDDSNNATSQEFFMSEFIANPDRYKDASNLGIIRTQYMGQTSTIVRETVGGEPIAFTQVFDAKLLDYLKEDDDHNVGYVRLLTVAREESNYAQNVGIKLGDFNKIKVDNEQELAYLVFATPAYKAIADKKDPKVKVVEIPNNDQYTMLSGNYITGIDYVVDKSKFEDTFAGRTTGIDKTRKLDYSTMSGWTNPNDKGWPVYTINFSNDYVVQEGDSFMVDAGAAAKGKQIMIQVGGEQAILRRPQGYYNGYATSKSALDTFEEIADGVFQFTIGEGTTVKKGKPLKVYMPYTTLNDAPDKINFLQIHNGTKLNEGAANLTLLKTRLINMHLYKQGKKGHFVLRYTLKNGAESSLKFEPKLTWKYEDKDGVMTGAANGATLPSGGNFYINTAVLKEGTDIIVDSYDGNGNKIDSETSWFKYIPLEKSPETVKLITWTDHSDKRSVLSINKSLYTPYQVLFTNDYADGTDDFYKDPRVLPADNAKFNTDTTQIVGYTKYDSGKVRTLYEGPQKLFSKVEAAGNEYDNDGNLKGTDVRKEITIAKKDIFDAQFAENSKTYKAYEYTFDLEKMLPYHSDDKTAKPLTLLKDMKFVSTASDGSSLPSDLIETRVRARVLFDANGGELTDGSAQVKKAVKIVPDNLKFYGEDGYMANGFEGANADTNTGDKFPEAPKLEGKNFLGWVTEAGKTALGNKNIASAEAFNNLPKEKVFTNTTPVEKHLVVYAIYSEDTVVTFDANGGTFEGGKDELSVKAEGSNVTKPTDPKRDGYTFKGWADSKTATTANENILTNVNASKTVYAVWEQKADKKLTLTDPEPVLVSDKKDLTAKEKDAVKQAVIDANPTLNLTKDDITVGSDGKVTVKTSDGKTGEIPADKTVKQKEVINNINPPAPPVEVNNPNGLTDDEKDKVKDAIIKANPDLNLKPDEVTVDDNGKVTINQGGKTGTVEAKDTVVKKDTILKLEAPDKVEVQDPNNLTQAEKDKVAAAVKEKNSLPDTAKITVDANGNVTVTDGDKKGELAGTDTVKPFDRTGKTLNDPKELTEVSDKNNLTEAEKEAVREAVKAANPDLHFKDEEIEVANDGTVKVPMGTNSDNTTKYETIEPSKTVKEDNKNTTISLKAPEKTKVADKSHLTKEEKDKVIAEVKKANQNLPADAKIEVADDGAVTVTSGTEPNQKVGLLSQNDTVEEILKAPVVSAKKDGSVTVKPADDQAKEVVVTYKDPQGNEKTITATKGDDGKWTLPKGTDKKITVDEITGEITLPADKVKNNEDVKAVAIDGTRRSDEVTEKAKDDTPPSAPKVEAKDDGSVEITPPADKDTKEVSVTYTPEGKTDPVTVTATKGDDGNWKLPENAPEGVTVDPKTGKVTIPADKVKDGTEVSAKAKDGNNNESKEAGKDNAKYVIKAPDNQITVDNAKALTPENKKAVEDAVRAKNPDLPTDAKVEVADDGAVTVKDKDGNVLGTISADKTVKQDENKLAVKAPTPVAVKDPSNLTPEEKQAIKDAVKKANPTLQDSEIVVNDDGSVTVTKDGKETTIGKDKTISTDVKVPKLTEVANPDSLTDDEKATVKQAVEDANKDGSGNSTLSEGATITVGNDGTVTVKDKDGKETIIPSSDTVKEKATPGAELKDPAKVAVKDPANLTPDEKTAIKKAVKDANPTLKDSEIVVNADGSVKVTKGGKETTLGKDKTISTDVKVPKLTEVDDPSSLKPEEKTSVKEAVKTANPTLQDGDIVVNDDGSVTVTKDGKETIIPASDAVTRKGGEKLADKLTPAYTEADAQAGKPSTITGPNFTDKNGDAASIPTGTKFELGADAPTGATVDENTGEVKYTPKAADAGKTVTIPVVVKYNDGSTDKVNVTVQVAPLEIKAPDTPITVDNAKALSKDDKDKVKKAVEDANKDGDGKSTLPEGAQIEVADDGTVTVKDKDGKEIGKLKPEQTVKQDESKLAVKAPEAVEVNDPENVSEEEQGKIKAAVIAANPDLADATITVDDKGNVTVTKDGKSATLTPAQTIKKAGEIKAPDTPVKVKDPSKLTDDEKEAVKKAVKDANPKLPADATIDVADDGTVTVKDKDGNEIGKLKPEQTVKGVVNAPEKPVEVKDPSNLTPEEKKAVEDAVKKANPDLPEGATVEVGKDGTVTVKDKDGNVIGKLPADKIIDKRVPRPLPELYYPDTTVGVGDERTIYPIGTPGYVSEALEGIDAPRGIYVRVNPDGSISIEVSPRYSGPSIFTIRGYVYVDGILTPISINVRVEGGSRRRHNRRDDVEDEDINEDTREVYTHKAYIFGYPDGTVRPNGNVTRAEAAAMLARLLEDENTASALKPAFTDTPSHWYNRAINAALSRGVMKGYPDGTFKPNAPITRAEFTQMISQIDAKPYGEAPFADVKDHWAKLAIGKEYAAGRISGYPDGTFRPNAPITRAEAAHILNKIFDRNYDSVSAIQSEDRMNINAFGDLFTSFWGYNDMVEATNTHTFRRRSKNSVSEDWSEINRISR